MASESQKNMEEYQGGNMTRLNYYLDILHWSAGDLSDALKVNRRTIFRWLNGQNETPENVLDWLHELAEFHKSHQFPVGWNSRGYD
jgi:hypothetical protein